MNSRHSAAFIVRGVSGFISALIFALILVSCKPAVSPLPTPTPSVVPKPCEHGEILHPEMGAPAQALAFVRNKHPQQSPPSDDEWKHMGRDSTGAALWAVGYWTLRMNDDLSIVIANDATGFQWKGRVGVRTPPGGCGNDEWVVTEASAAMPPAAAATVTPQCTPELVKRVCKESEYCFDDRGWAKDAVWDWFKVRYPGQGPEHGIELWPRNLVGQVTTELGTFDVYTQDWAEGWTLSIARGEPPLRFILANDTGSFRWEAVAKVRVACEGCNCREVYDTAEVSVALPTSTQALQCDLPPFKDVMLATLAHVRQQHPAQPLSDDLIGGAVQLRVDWTARPTRVTVMHRDTKFRWEGEMAWHTDAACRLQVDSFRELPPATPTPARAAVATPGATPAGPPDLAALHLGWVWPEGKLQAQDQFALDAQGTVYINDRNGRLHALLPPGKELWAFEEGQEGMTPPVLGPDGHTLYILSLMPDKLWALGTDGVKRWDAYVKHQPIALPLVAPDGAVYISTMGGGYRHPPDGKEPEEFKWSDYFGPDSAAFDPQGRLYARDWTEVWVHSPDGKKERTCPIEKLSGSLAGRSAGGFIYTTSEGDLVAASPECRELWRYAAGELKPRSAWEPMAIGSDGSVFAARENGEIVALDPTGKLRWKHGADKQFGEPLHLLPAPGGTLYAVSGSGQVSAFDAQGRQVWMHQLPAAGRPGPPHLTPDGGLALVQGGRLWYFTTAPGMRAAEPTPVPLPTSRAAAEEEIVSFVLNGLGCKIESIFIWAPARSGMTGTDTSNPIRVWWCWGGKFTERKDMQEAIAEAKKRNDEAAPTAESYPVARFEFTIAVDASLQRAEVYVGWMRGRLWGEGNVYTLKRSATGEWWVVDSKQVWIS